MSTIGIIGGSGFYDLPGTNIPGIETPWGVSGDLKQLSDVDAIFLARHGSKHNIPPHQVNYRANIYALKTMGVDFILATNAVGSCVLEYAPGSYVIPDNVIDLTHSRGHTFYEYSETPVPDEFQRVVHTDVTNPFSEKLRGTIKETFEGLKIPYINGGTIVVSNGPRYETAAEVKVAQLLGGSLLGMTTAPEVFLARELGMEYASIAVVTNYGAGLQKSVSHEEVVDTFGEKIELLKKVVLTCVESLM